MAPDPLEKTIDDLKAKLTKDVLVVEDRVPLIQKLLKSQQESSEDVQIPGVLLDNDWSQDEVAGSQNFARGIVQNLRDNFKDDWKDLLKTCTDNQRDVLEEFTAGKDLEDIYQKFDFGSTRGTRAELGALKGAKTIELPVGHSADDHHESLGEKFKELFHHKKQAELGLYEDVGHKQKLLVISRSSLSIVSIISLTFSRHM